METMQSESKAKAERNLVLTIHGLTLSAVGCASDKTRKKSERLLHAVRARTLEETYRRIVDSLGLPDTETPVREGRWGALTDNLPDDVRVDSIIAPSRSL